MLTLFVAYNRTPVYRDDKLIMSDDTFMKNTCWLSDPFYNEPVLSPLVVRRKQVVGDGSNDTRYVKTSIYEQSCDWHRDVFELLQGNEHL